MVLVCLSFGSAKASELLLGYVEPIIVECAILRNPEVIAKAITVVKE